MKRSLELLIAEALQKGGIMTNIQDAINHLSSKGYSFATYQDRGSEYYIVTVVITNKILIIYSIDYVDEKVNLVTKVGFE